MNLYETIEHILRSNPAFIGENNEVLKTKVTEAVSNLDPFLVKAFKHNDVTREVFFTQLDDILVLNQEKLNWVVNSKEFLEDSYTAYTAKIGLTTNGRFLNANTDVVLDFPYKDAVIMGGQDKDDQKRQEIMYHEVIGYDQITNLNAPKILANAKRYTVEGVEENIVFDDKDNLIIKGNNYTALNSLLEQYRGKVKLIYIDPPYNTDNDSFQYNDRFNHASWLTFMKNRLEVAKNLLDSNGVIFLQCDDNEQAYLKVLLDDIFGEHNFVNNVVVKMSELSGNKMTHVEKRFSKIKEYLLVYKNGPVIFNPILATKEKWDDEYNKVFKNFTKEDKKYIDNIVNKSRSNITVTPEEINEVDKILSNVSMSNTKTEFMNSDQDINYDEWLHKNSYRIFRTAASSSVKQLADEKKRYNHNQFFSELSKREGFLYIIKSDYSDESTSPRVQVLFAEDYLTTYVGDLWTDISTTGLEAEGGVSFKNGKKPEKLIKRIIEFSTDESDLVLDFFMGSATTQAVAMKMNRRFIGIEQMDYINTISVPRLKKVIEGEQGGISEDLDWKGGGSFVYCELLEDGQRIIKLIESATERTISGIKEMIYNSEKIVPYILRSDLENADSNFDKLTLAEQKQVLIGLIDKNKLYVNYSSIDDEEYKVSDEDKVFSKSFYEGSGRYE